MIKTTTLTHYESRITHAVMMGGHHVGLITTTKHAFYPRQRSVKINAWCSECGDDLDAQGNTLDDDDNSDARYHLSVEAAEVAVGKHAIGCGEVLREMTRGQRVVAA